MIVSKARIYEDSLPSDSVVKLKSSILFQLYDKNIPCEEHSDYIKTELFDFYPRESSCFVVSNATLNVKFSKEYRFNKITSDTKPEKISEIAKKVVDRVMDITVKEYLLS